MADWNTPDGVEYLVTTSGGVVVRTRGGGKAFVQSMQYLAKQVIGLSGAAWDGTVFPSEVAEDGVLGRSTLRAIYAALRQKGATAAELAAVQRDASLAQGAPLGADTAAAAIKYLTVDPPARRVEFNPTDILIRYRTAQPNGSLLHADVVSRPTAPGAPAAPPATADRPRPTPGAPSPVAPADPLVPIGPAPDPWSTWLPYRPPSAAGPEPSIRRDLVEPVTAPTPYFGSAIPMVPTSLIRGGAAAIAPYVIGGIAIAAVVLFLYLLSKED